MLNRIYREYMNILPLLGISGSAEYLIKSVIGMTECIRQKKLAPLDAMMVGNYGIRYKHENLIIPAKDIDEVLPNDDTPTFGAIREMFANDVYLRGFKDINAGNIIDLGANRGFFMLIALRVMKAKFVVGVEPTNGYALAFDKISHSNNLQHETWQRYYKFIGPKDGDQTISINEICCQHRFDRINFIKCDIEGAEFDLFANNNEWLSKVDNIAMELHPTKGDVTNICKILEENNFDVYVTDQFFNEAELKTGDYLYASSCNNLAR